MTEDEMVGWHHRLDGHGLEQALGAGDGWGGLARCSPWGRRESGSSMPQPKTRPDSPVPSLQGPCDRSLKSEVPCGSCLNWR